MALRLSYSSISTYEKCPFQYFLQYVEKLEAPRSPALSFGSSLHGALERFHSGTDKLSPGLDDLLRFMDEAWEGEGYADAEEEAAYRQRGREILTRYYESNCAKPAIPVALEQRFLLPMEGWELSGVMDRVDRYPDGSYEIIDYKTNKKLPPLSRLQEDMQLPIYQMAAVQVLGIKPVKLTFHYLVPDQRYTTRAHPQEELERLKARLQEVAEHIKRGEFEPRPNNLCRWCDVRLHCPLEQQGALRIPALVDSYADLLHRRVLLEERIGCARSELLDLAGSAGEGSLHSTKHRLRITECDGNIELELADAVGARLDPADEG